MGLTGLLTTALGAGLVHAAPPETHVMHWSQGGTRHATDGANNLHYQAEIRVELQPSLRVVVTDSGSYLDHNMYSRPGGFPSNHDDRIKWRNVWLGTWFQQGDQLLLSLLLKSRECKHEEQWNDEPPKPHRCRDVSPQLNLTCKADTVTTDDLSKPPQVPVAVWTCTPAGTAKLADTPSRWVLGKQGCVQVVAGYGPVRYRGCEKPD